MAVLDVAGYVLRARRRADLSQRELAERLGVSQPTIARLESPAATATVDRLETILDLGEMRLAVVDGDGHVVDPFPAGAVRDNAGRRFPAHLDLEPPGAQPGNRGMGIRHDRAPVKAWYAGRQVRDALTAAGVDRPVDHPTVTDLATWRAERATRWRAPRMPEPPECTCPDVCFEACCVEECECQCEA
jgi:transcriptional regulator with XRE-family HTH domain